MQRSALLYFKYGAAQDEPADDAADDDAPADDGSAEE
jgi:hypothetical protein